VLGGGAAGEGAHTLLLQRGSTCQALLPQAVANLPLSSKHPEEYTLLILESSWSLWR